MHIKSRGLLSSLFATITVTRLCVGSAASSSHSNYTQLNCGQVIIKDNFHSLSLECAVPGHKENTNHSFKWPNVKEEETNSLLTICVCVSMSSYEFMFVYKVSMAGHLLFPHSSSPNRRAILQVTHTLTNGQSSQLNT